MISQEALELGHVLLVYVLYCIAKGDGGVGYLSMYKLKQSSDTYVKTDHSSNCRV